MLIVGAGPVGLFLALLLQRQRLDVAIIEKREGAVFDPRAAVIWPRTAEVLAAQGLTPAFARERRLLEGVELNVRGGIAASEQSNRLYDQAAAWLAAAVALSLVLGLAVRTNRS